MPRDLIINADDFGLTPGINRAIADLHRCGVLPSTTLMATGPAFVDAVERARALPGLGVGCHIVLTDGAPLSPPASIPTLLGPDRRTLRPSLLDFVQALLRGAITLDDIRREALAQIHKLQNAGVRITHLDAHKHAHLFPPVRRCLLEIAERTGIPAIRNPFEAPWSRALGHGSRLRQLQLLLLRHYQSEFLHQLKQQGARVLTTDGSIGIAATGKLDATALTQILHHLPTGTWELVCHPGHNDADLDAVRTRLRAHRDTERQALLDIVPAALSRPDGPSLISFAELASRGQTQPGASPEAETAAI